MDKTLKSKLAVSQKIEETTRETERLKQELEALIAAGIRGRTTPPSQSLNAPYTTLHSDVEKTNKVQIIKSYDTKHSHHVNRKLFDTTDEPEAVKKPKPYNVDEARDYIKKQRNKRAEELKGKKTNVVSSQLRKEKLQELQQKANEIVKKNIEAKRARSKSREPPIVRSRTAVDSNRAIRSRSVSRNRKEPDRVEDSVIVGFNCASKTARHVPVSNRPSRTITTGRNPNLLYPPEPAIDVQLIQNDAVPPLSVFCPLEKPAEKKSESLSQKYFQKHLLADGNILKNDGLNLAAQNPKPVQIKSASNVVDLKKDSLKPDTLSLNSKNSSTSQKPSNKEKIQVTSNITLRSPRNENPKPTPDWLKEKQQSDPYNFINTVKRQLDDIINEKRPLSKDVAVQENFDDLFKKNSISHKLANLDSKSVEHVELRTTRDGITITKPSSWSENEYDTSKNIPSISSESGSSLRRNAEIVKQYQLSDFKPLENAPLSLDAEKVRTKLSKVSASDKYSSDFLTPDLTKSRESIISFNCVKISPRRTEDDKRTQCKADTDSQGSEVPKSTARTSQESTESLHTVPSQFSSNLEIINPSQLSENYEQSDTRKSSDPVSAGTVRTVGESSEIKSSNPHSTIKEIYESKSDTGSPSSKKKTRGSTILSKSESNLLTIKQKRKSEDRQALMKNITLRCDGDGKENVNNIIHLKFESEIHLLSDFNQTIQRFSEIEKNFHSLRTRDTGDNDVVRRVLQDRNTQTSIMSSSESMSKISKPSSALSRVTTERSIPELQLTSVKDLSTVQLDDTILDDPTDISSSLSQVHEESSQDVTGEHGVVKNVVGMSLRVVDQLLKDEDARIENWKKMLKIREHALLDRTRGELVYLEMQKKQLISTGKLSEASMIKKKQRGIILKHQQEKHEMQRLKQMQKQASNDRKALLKKERNQIKHQLLSEKMLSRIKPNTQRERLSGPFKVVQSSETTIHSETSRAGTDQEVKSVVTRTSRTDSVVNIVSDSSFNEQNLELLDFKEKPNLSSNAVSNLKKSLLMREHALAKRRKTIEDLLRWHKKLLDEEKAIEDLENKIGTIIAKIPSKSNEKSDKSGNSSNTSREIVTTVSMSQTAVERLQTPIETSLNIPQSEDSKAPSSANYSADFEVESAHSDGQSSVSSISQLIEDFNKIEDNLLMLSSKKSDGELSEKKEISEDVEAEQSSISIEETVEVKKDDKKEISIEIEEVIEGANAETSESVTSEVIEPIVEEKSSTEEDELVNEVIASEVIEDVESSQVDEIQSSQESGSEQIDSEVQLEEINATYEVVGAGIDSEEEIIEGPNIEDPKTEDTATALQTSQSDKESVVSQPSTSQQTSIPEEVSEEDELQQLFENKTDEEKAASLGVLATSIDTDEQENSVTPTESTSQQTSSSDSPQKSSAEIKKYVHQMLGSPRMQDLCVMTHDTSPISSPDVGSPMDESKSFSLGSEAEELHRKQLAIEQEIKLIKEQQQKQISAPFYVREIPNKPPPPYTPPSKSKSPKTPSVTPKNKEVVEQITEYSAKIIHKAYISNNLEHISISDNTLNLIAKNIDKGCYKFVFDLCKEIAIDHYSQFVEESGPSWLKVEKKPILAVSKPLDVVGLKKLMNKKLLEMFGIEKPQGRREKAIMKWSRKKRDNVDEVLVQEMQAEETTWTNLEKDELIVKDRVTTQIMDMLLKDTIGSMLKAIQKKSENDQ